GRAAATAAKLRRLRARRSGFVELALRVVDVGEAVVRLDIIRLRLDRLFVRGLGFVVFLLLRVGVADVVVAVGARRAQLRAVRELRDRFIEVAGAARGPAFLERLLQLRVLGRLFLGRAGGLCRQHE